MTIPSKEVRRLIALVAPHAQMFGGLDGAIVGYTQVGGDVRVVYDRTTILKILTSEGLSQAAAESQIAQMHPNPDERTPLILTILHTPGFKQRKLRGLK